MSIAVRQSASQSSDAGEVYIETYYAKDKVERINTDDMEWLQMSERLTELEKYPSDKGPIARCRVRHWHVSSSRS